MRNLTIKREKSFVACLAPMKVYIADPFSNDLVINGVPCRKLGVLKNGKTSTFAIDDNATRIFVIADKFSKNYANEFCDIPAGPQDIFLSGQNEYNPLGGNMFRFFGMPTEEMLQNRRKGTKRGLIILIAVFLICLMATLAPVFLLSYTDAEPKDFTYDGMTITLTDAFSETQMQGYTVCYDSPDAAVFALREAFTAADGAENYTVEQYGEMLLENGNFPFGTKLQSKSGLTFFEYAYTNPNTNVSYIYYTVLYKAPDAFWAIQFTTTEEDFDLYEQTFVEWAKSVRFGTDASSTNAASL